MTLEETMQQLEAFGNEGTKKTLLKHGAKEPFFGVKVGDLKKIVKKIKKDQALAEELYATGNSDAMYLAGLIADEKAITKSTIKKWMKQAYWYYLSEYTVAWIAADSGHGWDLALEWIDSEEENIAAGGWSTLSNWVLTQADEDLDIEQLKSLMHRAEKGVHQDENRVSYAMNQFIIATAGAVEVLKDFGLEIAERIGKVKVDMNGTACKVPVAKDYILKMEKMNRIGYKKKMARC